MKRVISRAPASREPRLVQGPGWSVVIEPTPPEPPLPWRTVVAGQSGPTSQPLQRWGWADLNETTIWVAALYLTGRDPNPRLLGNSTSEYPPNDSDLMNWVRTKSESEALFCQLRDAVNEKKIGSTGTKDSKGAPRPWGAVRIKWVDAHEIARNGSLIAARPVAPPIELEGPARLSCASDQELRDAITTVYDDEKAEGRPAPNKDALSSLVQVLLARADKQATQPRIRDMADEQAFKDRRNASGHHLRNKSQATN